MCLRSSNAASPAASGTPLSTRFKGIEAADLLRKVGAHYAMSSLFDGYEDREEVYGYTIEREDYNLIPSGKARLYFPSASVAVPRFTAVTVPKNTPRTTLTTAEMMPSVRVTGRREAISWFTFLRK